VVGISSTGYGGRARRGAWKWRLEVAPPNGRGFDRLIQVASERDR